LRLRTDGPDDERVGEALEERAQSAPTAARSKLAERSRTPDGTLMRIGEHRTVGFELLDGVVDGIAIGRRELAVLRFGVGMVNDAPHLSIITETL